VEIQAFFHDQLGGCSHKFWLSHRGCMLP
jgi:hypothetical protein